MIKPHHPVRVFLVSHSFLHGNQLSTFCSYNHTHTYHLHTKSLFFSPSSLSLLVFLQLLWFYLFTVSLMLFFFPPAPQPTSFNPSTDSTCTGLSDACVILSSDLPLPRVSQGSRVTQFWGVHLQLKPIIPVLFGMLALHSQYWSSNARLKQF